MLQLDYARYLAENLEKKGWKRLGNKSYDLYPYYLGGKLPVAVAQTIRINPDKSIKENVDAYFKRAMARMKKYGIKKFVVCGSSGTIPIPDYFHDFCKKNGIDIVFIKEINSETIEQIIEGLLK